MRDLSRMPSPSEMRILADDMSESPDPEGSSETTSLMLSPEYCQ